MYLQCLSGEKRHVIPSYYLCTKFNRKPKPASLVTVSKPTVRIVQGNEKGFSYLLKILLPDRGNAPKGLKFLIADTLVFMGGEPRFLVYNSRVIAKEVFMRLLYRINT